jgi:hypothetical protein
MKSTKFLAIAFIAVASVTSQVVAQRATAKSTEVNEGIDKSSPVLMKIVPTATGFDIVCENNSNSSGGGMAVGRQAQSIGYSEGGKQEDFLVIKLKEVFITSHQIVVTSNGKKIPVTIEDGVFIFPENLPDGDYKAVCSWSWGVSQSSGVHSQKAIDCHIRFINGVCVEMSVTEKNCAAGKHFKEAKLD